MTHIVRRRQFIDRHGTTETIKITKKAPNTTLAANAKSTRKNRPIPIKHPQLLRSFSARPRMATSFFPGSKSGMTILQSSEGVLGEGFGCFCSCWIPS